MNQQFVSTHQVESGFQGNPSVFTRIPPDFQKRIFFLANATDQIRLGIADREIYLFLAGKLRNTRGAKVGWRSWWTLPVSIAEIVEGTGYHRCTVSKSLAKLARLGFIDFKDHALRCKRVYYIYAWNAQYQRYKAEGTAEAPVTVADVIAEPSKSETPPRETETPVAMTAPQMDDCPDETTTRVCEVDHNDVLGSSHFSEPDPPVESSVEWVSEKPHPSRLDNNLDINTKNPPISPHVEPLLSAWNESHDYEEGEGEDFCQYLETAIHVVEDRYGLSTEQSVDALIYAFGHTRHTAVGHPADYPTYYTGDPAYESHPTPTGKRVMKSAVHHIKSQNILQPNQPSSPPSVDPPGQPKPTESKDEAPELCESSAAPLSVEKRIREALRHVHSDKVERIASLARRMDTHRLAGVSDAEIVEAWEAMKAENEAVRLSRHSHVDGGLERIGVAA